VTTAPASKKRHRKESFRKAHSWDFGSAHGEAVKDRERLGACGRLVPRSSCRRGSLHPVAHQGTGRESKTGGVGLPHVVVWSRGAHVGVARFISWRTRTRGGNQRQGSRLAACGRLVPRSLFVVWLALHRGAPGHGGGNSKTGGSAFRVLSFVSAELVHGVARFVPWRTRGIKDREPACRRVWSFGPAELM
jgi:hypothetical protein